MSRRRVVVVGLSMVLVSSLAQAQVLRVGAEFQANAQVNSLPSIPVAASSPNGEFVAVWLSKLQSESLHRILARRFSSAGSPIGSEFQINAGTVGAAATPVIAADAEGDFIVVWMGTVGPAPAAFARRFSSGGVGLGTEFRVDSYAVGAGPTEPDVAAAADGSFLVAWSDLGINARRFDSAGAPLGSQFRISATLADGETAPDVAADGSGNFVVVWVDGNEVIEGRRFAGNGAALGTEFQVDFAPYSEYGPVTELDAPAVAADAGGNFVVAWERYVEAASDEGSARADIFIRAFDSTGNPQGGGFKVTGAPHYYYNPAIAASAEGEFIVVWDGLKEDGSGINVYAQRFGSQGDEIGEKFRANTTTSGDQRNPAVAVSSDSGFVLVWGQDAGAELSDARGQRFATKLTTPICNDGSLAGKALMKLSKLGSPEGDEKLMMKGAFSFPPGNPAVFDPMNAGAQILVEDLGAGTVLFELSHRTLAIPGGNGCGPNDVWKANDSRTTFKYKNKSGALPPDCTAGSANGFAFLKLKDKRASTGEIVFKLTAKGSALATPVGPLRVSLAFGAGAAESDAGECGVAPFAAEQCGAVEATFECRIAS